MKGLWVSDPLLYKVKGLAYPCPIYHKIAQLFTGRLKEPNIKFSVAVRDPWVYIICVDNNDDNDDDDDDDYSE